MQRGNAGGFYSGLIENGSSVDFRFNFFGDTLQSFPVNVSAGEFHLYTITIENEIVSYFYDDQLLGSIEFDESKVVNGLSNITSFMNLNNDGSYRPNRSNSGVIDEFSIWKIPFDLEKQQKLFNSNNGLTV